MAFERYVLPDEEPAAPSKLNIHMFKAIIQEFLDSQKTGLECREALEAQLGVTLTAAESNDITNMLNYIQNGSDLANRLKRSDEAYRVFTLAEAGVSWYDTRAKIATRLSFS